MTTYAVTSYKGGGHVVPGKLPVPGRPTLWITVGQGPSALAVGAGGGCLDIFTPIYPFFPLSPSLWGTARCRLKYCLKGLFIPKPTNQPNLTFCITVGQGPTALAVGVDGAVWTFLLSSILSFLFLPLFGRQPDID